MHRVDRAQRRLQPMLSRIEQRFTAFRAPVLRSEPPETRRTTRILLPVANPAAAPRLARFAAALASVWEAEVIVLTVVRPANEGVEALQTSGGWTLAGREGEAVRAALAVFQGAGVPAGYTVRVSDDVGWAIRHESNRLQAGTIVLGWHGEDQSGRGRRPPVSMQVLLDHPPSDLVVIGGRGDAVPGRILVLHEPSPDGLAAFRLARELARGGGSVTVLKTLSQDATLDEIERASRRLGEDVTAWDSKGAGRLVVRGLDPAQAVLATVARGFEGILMPARRSLTEHLRFGDVQSKVAAESAVPVIVVQGHSGILRTMLWRLWRLFYRALPTLSPSEREEVEATIETAASPSVDFFVMIGLSATIASFGLLQNSPAVIIGAMLVAPLMGAIIGVGLGVVTGDPGLIRRAGMATLKGALLALGVGAVVGLLPVRLDPLPTEIDGRTHPTILDLGVAMASGLAAAYAMCRKNVSASLAGVAIAAALVPPLATAGIGLANGMAEVAFGAGLLFITNLVAIAAMAALMLLLLGFGPAPGRELQAEIHRRGLGAMAVLLVVVAVPLGFLTFQTVRLYQDQLLSQRLIAAARAEVEAIPDADLVELELSPLPAEPDAPVEVNLLVRLPAATAERDAALLIFRLGDALSRVLGRPATIDLSIVPTRRIEVQPTSQSGSDTPEAAATTTDPPKPTVPSSALLRPTETVESPASVQPSPSPALP